jgi:hypothetical protein
MVKASEEQEQEQEQQRPQQQQTQAPTTIISSLDQLIDEPKSSNSKIDPYDLLSGFVAQLQQVRYTGSKHDKILYYNCKKFPWISRYRD